MRFLCEQCKAKYQIADEKVAGKTVRMKCRKCGHLIEVKAEVTETSVASKPPAPDPDESSEEATRVGVDMAAIMAASKPAGPPGKPPPPRPAAGVPQRMATSLASAKPAKPAPPARSDALAGAFQRAVTKTPDEIEVATSSEWYVAINGVPVGPVRISELRRKASSGAVTEESLCWQEGMDEWRPLRTIPDLLAIVHEGLTSERPSLVSPAPAAVRPSAPSPPRAAPRPEPVRPSAPAPPPARSNVVSLTSRLATAEKLEPEVVPDPFAASHPVDANKSPISGIDALSSPLSPLGPPAPSVAQQTVVIPRKTGPNWVVVGMVVAFGAFGATAGVAVFFNKQQPTIVNVTAPAAPSGQAASPTANTGAVAVGGADPQVVQVEPGATGHASGGAGGHANGGGGTAAATATGHAVDPNIAALLGGPGGGPAVNGGTGGGSASSALDQAAIERVVQQRSAGVKRTCWERGGATESNVNVHVHLVIAASGNVQSANADGNDPIVSKCIESSVKNWSFPVSSGATTVDIPFHFLRQ